MPTHDIYYIYIPTSFKAFHDCVGPNGCDGCINTEDNGSNAGLAEIVEILVNERNANFPVSKILSINLIWKFKTVKYT